MDKNTQHPVAWIGERGLPEFVAGAPKLTTGTQLYTAPPVPRDVLMAFGAAVRDAAKRADFDIGEDVDISAIADRYASKVQSDVELVSYAPNMATCTLRIGDEQYLFDRHVDKPEPVNPQGMRKKFEEWAPANGYDIRPSRIGLPFADGFTNSAWEIWQAAIAAAEAAQPVGQQAEHNLTDVRCECCGYLTHQREHMGCIRAANPPAVAVPDASLRSRVADLIHLLQFFGMDAVSDADKSQALSAMDDIRVMLSAAQKQEGV